MSDTVRAPDRVLLTLAVAVAFIVTTTTTAYFIRRDAASHRNSLNTGVYESAVGLGVDVGQVMTYGDIIMTNDGRDPIVIQGAELLTNDAGAVVEDVRLLDVDAVPPGTLKGEAFGYEPPVEANGIPGATMLPSRPDHRKHYQLIFAVRVKSAGPTLFHSVRIRFTIEGKRYMKYAYYQLRICTPKGIDCHAPQRKN
ncbi:hypothetical protein KZZ52_20790 [Dactylosporangium sp. AC04546]|uniref:hypothetical protein n=1 Tax=Dactylosporangium sp. AC04546 TaxID=2862460 RepID=UPI001EE0DCF0|nr:hypothetical protein [Dactylosporangium sp. AC04546]WVK87727.1 hypothetical protein KZZ52_20790 [Dactylosporangium sp. AC04546]